MMGPFCDIADNPPKVEGSVHVYTTDLRAYCFRRLVGLMVSILDSTCNVPG